MVITKPNRPELKVKNVFKGSEEEGESIVGCPSTPA